MGEREWHGQFQSTPPVKAATHGANLCKQLGGISIHAAREGGDPSIFNVKLQSAISIHAAREGGD